MVFVAGAWCSLVLLALYFQALDGAAIGRLSAPSFLESTNILGEESALQGITGSRFRNDNKGAGASQADQCEVTRQYAPKPSLCPQGNDRFSLQDLRSSLPGFKAMFAFLKSTFDKEAPCCMGINHQFAIFHSVRKLDPLAIIESGVAAGHGTFLLRSVAGSGIPIFSLDPGDPGDRRGYLSREVARQVGGVEGWRDTNPNTKYLTGSSFKDFAEVQWNMMIPDPQIRARTLVILDDHQSSLERLKVLKRWGFRYAFYEDNYPFQVSTSQDPWTCKDLGGSQTYTKALFGDAYSPDTVCSSLPKGIGMVLHKDRFGKKCRWLTRREHEANVKWMQEHVASYYEFPALFSACAGNVSRPTILGEDPKILKTYGFPAPQAELWKYGHLYPALIELKL